MNDFGDDDENDRGDGGFRPGRYGENPQLSQLVHDFEKWRANTPISMRLIGLGAAVLLGLVALSTALYQVQPEEVGVIVRFGKYIRTTEPGLRAKIPFIENSNGTPRELQRMELDLLREFNVARMDKTGPDDQLEARINSFELAFRMQAAAPGLQDISDESQSTQKSYGLDNAKTKNFGRQCLMARRFIERGVRFVQCTHSYKWDQHGNLKGGHSSNAMEVDQPIAGLLKDLKTRGLLDDTLVLWGGEFGRTPVAQGTDGRDHNPQGFSMWLAGGGIRGGLTYGKTDDYGYYAVEDKVHFHDLHATMLHLLGMDHLKLTYRYAGRDFRLTDIHGEVVHDIIA